MTLTSSRFWQKGCLVKAKATFPGEDPKVKVAEVYVADMEKVMKFRTFSEDKRTARDISNVKFCTEVS